MKAIDDLDALAKNLDSETCRYAAIVIRDCYRVLIDSGQLEVNPPRTLCDFVDKEQKDSGDEQW